MSIPYTYRVYCIPEDMYYYGVRYSKGCDPSDLWSTYFTSSKYIYELRQKYTDDQFTVEIRKIFNHASDAINWESRVLRKIMNWPNYYNDHNGRAFHPDVCRKGSASWWASASDSEKSARKTHSGKILAKVKRKLKAEGYYEGDEFKKRASRAGKIGSQRLIDRGFFQSDSWKKSSSRANTTWITNGSENKRYPNKSLDDFLERNPNWYKGTTKNVVVPENSGTRKLVHSLFSGYKMAKPGTEKFNTLINEGWEIK